MIHKPPPSSPPAPPQGSIERASSDITTVTSGSSLLLWKYVLSINETLKKMTLVLDSLPNVAVWGTDDGTYCVSL